MCMLEIVERGVTERVREELQSRVPNEINHPSLRNPHLRSRSNRLTDRAASLKLAMMIFAVDRKLQYQRWIYFQGET